MDRDRAALVPRLPVVAAGLAAAGFLVALVVWPLVAVLRRSLAGVGPERTVEILTGRSVWSVVTFTVGQAVASALLTLILGLPIAHLLARYRFHGRSALRAFVLVPFVLPTVVVASAFDALFDVLSGPVPVIERLGDGLLAVLGAHVFFNLAVVVRIVGGAWSAIGRRQADAAAVLGAAPWRAWLTVTLPRLRPALFGSFLLVFLFSFTSYGVIRVLGGLRMATVETEIHRYAINRQEFDVAAVLASVQLVVVVTVSALAARFQRSGAAGSGADRAGSEGLSPVAGMARRFQLLAVVGVVGLLQAVPMAVMVERSLRVGSGYGLTNYRALAQRVDLLPTSALAALGNSALFALLAAVVAGGVGAAASSAIVGGGALGRRLESLAFVPLGVSAVTLGFGYLVGFAAFDLRRSWWLVPVAHSVVGMPFVIAAMVPAARSVGRRLPEVAAALGASPWRVLGSVYWPLTRRALATGVGFAAAVSLGEFGATSFLGRTDATFTAPLAIFRLLGTPGDAIRGQAMALSVTVGILVAAVAALIERRRPVSGGLL